MYLYFFLIVEVILLFVVSSRMQRALSSALHAILHNRSVLIAVFAVLFFPGIFLHELSHLLIALLLQVPVGEVNLFPDLDSEENDVRMGSVAIATVDPIRRSLIGVAPIFFGFAAVLGILFFVFQPGQSLIWWELVIAFYLIFSISNTMFSSKKDLEGTPEILLAIIFLALLIFAVLYFLGVRLSFDLSNSFASATWLQAVSLIDLFLLIPLAINFCLLFFLRFATRR